MRRIILSTLGFILSMIALAAQLNFSADEAHLAFYADVLVNADAAQHRVKANEIFYQDIKETLQKEGSFEHDFASLKWISFQTPADSTFRLISWQLKSADDEFSYFGFYQDADQLIELESSVEYSKNLSYQELSAEQWYGRLIYDMVPFEDERGAYYMIFGFRQLDQFNKTKVIDILRVDDAQLSFGAAIFDDGAQDKAKNRLAFLYSADAVLNVDYNPGLKMLVYDHLVQRMGRIPGQGPTYLPDGSYEAYKLEAGEWVYVEQLYNDIIEKPNTSTRRAKVDILGRPKKN